MSPFFNGSKNRNRKREKKTSFVFIPSQKFDLWLFIVEMKKICVNISFKTFVKCVCGGLSQKFDIPWTWNKQYDLRILNKKS